MHISQKFFLSFTDKGFSRLLKVCYLNCHKIVNEIVKQAAVKKTLKITQKIVALLTNV